MKSAIQIGTRSSRLALIQAEWAQEFLSEKFPELSWNVVPLCSPGDRDKASDLMTAADDFFTRDLDQAVLDGSIDCAVHSAKDLPGNLPAGIDGCWLPGGADPRDVLVCRPQFVGQGCHSFQSLPHNNEASLLPVESSLVKRGRDASSTLNGLFDIVVSNPPYIQSEVCQGLDASVREYEPLLALDGGEDGMDLIRPLAKQAAQVLKPGGHLFVEIGYDQGQKTSCTLRGVGFETVRVVKDYAGPDRIVAGSLRA